MVHLFAPLKLNEDFNEKSGLKITILKLDKLKLPINIEKSQLNTNQQESSNYASDSNLPKVNNE